MTKKDYCTIADALAETLLRFNHVHQLQGHPAELLEAPVFRILLDRLESNLLMDNGNFDLDRFKQYIVKRLQQGDS